MPAPPYDDAWLADYKARAAGWRGTGGARNSSSPATAGHSLPAAAHRTAGLQGAAASEVNARAGGRGASRAGEAAQGGQIILAEGERIPGHIRVATLILAGIPVAKGRPRIARGRAYTPEKTARWERAAKVSAREQWGLESPLDGAVRVALDVVLPVPASWSRKRRADALDLRILPQGRPDLDNYIKATFDALNEVAWVDDAQVVEMTARKVYGDRPRVEVRVECL